MSNRQVWSVLGGYVAGLIAASLALGLGIASGQDGGLERPVDSAGEQSDDAESDGPSIEEQRAQLRERLVRRLEWTRERAKRYVQQEQGLARAIERLDAGESAQVIAKDMRERADDAVRSTRRDGTSGQDPSRRGPVSHRGGRFAKPLDPETRRQVLGMLEAQAPSVSRQVAEIGNENAEQTDRLLQRIAPKLEEIRRAQAHDPELATLMIVELHANLELTIRSRDLQGLLDDESAEEQKVAIARELVRDSVRSSFDAHLAIKEHEVRTLEARLGELRGEIERRQQMRDDFVDRIYERVGSRG